MPVGSSRCGSVGGRLVLSEAEHAGTSGCCQWSVSVSMLHFFFLPLNISVTRSVGVETTVASQRSPAARTARKAHACSISGAALMAGPN